MTLMPTQDDRGPLRLPRRRRYTFYFIGIGVFVTGLLWIFYHYFMRTEGPFGFRNHPLEVWWLKLHGAFSFGSLWMLGVLWAIHIVRGWNMRWRRWSGGTLSGVALALIITGYGLYYIEGRDWREWTSVTHWIIGLVSFVLFFVHWLSKSLPHRDPTPYPWPWHRKRHPVGGPDKP